MKTNLLFSFLVISAFAVNAQITINTGDMPVAGQTFIYANDTNATSFGSSGANQTWNFAAWANHSTDTNSFYIPSDLPGSSYFPTATLAMGDSSEAAFIKNSSSAVEILGFYSDFGFGPTQIEFIPPQKFLSFPSTYLTSYYDTSGFELKFAATQPGLDSMQIISSTIYSSTIDAWGTITTPANPNVNSLRQQFIEITTETIYIKPTGLGWTLSPPAPGMPNPSVDTTNNYRWWSNTEKFPVAEINADGNDVVYNASYLLITETVGVNEKSITQNDVTIFPNPASDKINITGVSTESYLVIFDVNGKLIGKSRLKRNSTSINTSNYENGIYFYQITTMSGKTLGEGKFVVSK